MENKLGFQIYNWMIKGLGLSGNDLLFFAFLFHNTGYKESYYFGSYATIADELNVGKTTSKYVLDRLIEQGLIIKSEEFFKGKNTQFYSIISENVVQKLNDYEKSVQNLNEKMLNFCVAEDVNPSRDNNNIIHDISCNSYVDVLQEKEKKLSTKKERDEFFEECWKMYRRKGRKKKARAQWDKLTAADYQKVKSHIPHYVSARELQYQSDFERYLGDRVFDNPVYKNNQLMFDPETTGSYNPYGNNSIVWNDRLKHYVILAPPEWGVVDGYTDEDRPENATLLYQSIPYVWNKETKNWERK